MTTLSTAKSPSCIGNNVKLLFIFYFADKPFGKDVRLYAIQLGNDVEAKLNFTSNPIPITAKWGYGPSFEHIIAQLPIPGEEGRYSTEIVVSSMFTEASRKFYFAWHKVRWLAQREPRVRCL